MKIICEPKVILDRIMVYVVKNMTYNETLDDRNFANIEKLLVIDCTGLGANSLIYINFDEALAGGVPNELLRRGIVSEKFITQNRESINSEIKEYINSSFEESSCNAILYNEERLYQVDDHQGFVYGDTMLFEGKEYKAFRKPGGHITKGIEAIKGDPTEFKRFIQQMTDGLPKAQIILAFELSGIIRQALNMKGVDIGELSSVLCVTGLAGCGKTAVTAGLKEMLFGGSVFSGGNITEVAMGRILKEAGIGPSIFDDTSSDVTANNEKVCALVRQVYNMSSGKARTTNNSSYETSVFSPMLQSRELAYSIGEMAKSFTGLNGFEVRLIELIVDKNNENPENLLAKSKDHADQYYLGRSKYTGQGIEFIRCFLENYQERILELYEEMKKQVLEIKQNDDQFCELDDRVVNRDAVIALSATIANDAYKLDMNINEIIRVLLKSHFVLHQKRKAKMPSEWLINAACMYAYGNKYDHRVVAESSKAFDIRRNIVARNVHQGREKLVIPLKVCEYVFDQEWENLKETEDNSIVAPDSQWCDWKERFMSNKDLLGIRSAGVMHKKEDGFKAALREWEYQDIITKGPRGYTVLRTLGGVTNIPCYELDIQNMLKATQVFAPVNEEMFAKIKDKDDLLESDISHVHEEKGFNELGI